MKTITRRQFLFAVSTLTAVLISHVTWANPPVGVLDTTHASVRAVIAVQSQITPDLMTVDGILGTAVGLSDAEEVALVVYVDRDAKTMADIVRTLPPRIRGTAVKVELTDKFRALAKPPGTPGGGGGGGGGETTVSHTAKQTPPIQLGTSGGWRYDLANGYCCGGTLGSLITKGGKQYILSNYHVLEADIVSGGNEIVAKDGDFVIQPGLIDVSCNADSAQNVAKLVKKSSLPNSNVDAAIAEVIPGRVSEDGAILQIGMISSQTIAAVLKQAVKKSGRTTALTRSSVSGLNATVSVSYADECAGGFAFTKTFTGQIVIANRGSKFIAGGDSGSLMVEDVATNPRAVGLLFAGSNTSAIANPIGEVLAFFGATMVGQ
jgi:hypothetical protein